MRIQRLSCWDENFNKDFVRSLKETGFAVISNVIPQGNYILNSVYLSWERYFRLSLEEKLNNKFDPKTHAGYFPFKSENAKDQELPDLKEFYHIYEQKDLPESLYNSHTMELMKILQRLGQSLLEEIDEDLGANGDLIKSTTGGPTLFRVIYYPELNGGDRGVRAAAHEDINLITLLPASTAVGLEAKDKEGNWHSVGTNPGDIIVNVGDMLAMYSRGEYISTTHRVINMPGDRYSMPLFIHPNPNFNLGEMCAGEYLSKRLKEILKK